MNKCQFRNNLRLHSTFQAREGKDKFGIISYQKVDTWLFGGSDVDIVMHMTSLKHYASQNPKYLGHSAQMKIYIEI